jgi:hypothetical protein
MCVSKGNPTSGTRKYINNTAKLNNLISPQKRGHSINELLKEKAMLAVL